jgi:hypothetical protein
MFPGARERVENSREYTRPSNDPIVQSSIGSKQCYLERCPWGELFRPRWRKSNTARYHGDVQTIAGQVTAYTGNVGPQEGFAPG